MSEEEDGKEGNYVLLLTNKLLRAIEEERRAHPTLPLQDVINAIWFLSYQIQKLVLEEAKNANK
jgi:hypothetical protein